MRMGKKKSCLEITHLSARPPGLLIRKRTAFSITEVWRSRGQHFIGSDSGVPNPDPCGYYNESRLSQVLILVQSPKSRIQGQVREWLLPPRHVTAVGFILTSEKTLRLRRQPHWNCKKEGQPREKKGKEQEEKPLFLGFAPPVSTHSCWPLSHHPICW